QREIRYQKLSKERSWIRPHLSKAPLPALKNWYHNLAKMSQYSKFGLVKCNK
nr:O-fucosyltransferase 7-like isoform X3 [Tanacetum cinerariifolium]